MMKLNVFKAVVDLAMGAKARRSTEHQEFLTFYRSLVETVPTEAIGLFGSMPVNVFEAGKQEDWAIELTATDYIWWKKKIESGARFVVDPSEVQLAMLNRMSKKADMERLSPDERKSLIALMEAP
jgi:hypothetical protein